MDYENIYSDESRRIKRMNSSDVTINIEEDQTEEKMLEIVTISDNRAKETSYIDNLYNKLYKVSVKTYYPLFDQLKLKDLFRLFYDHSDDLYDDLEEA